ncbi:MAG TPA: hypothetical protein PKE66_04795, partial [Pyrinomonadaceae bacterium]|nr:hypothetical protein [Pyrinomonadaceae bacterium]
MKCQECNSEISEQDSFCPYCGIVLTSIPVVEPEPLRDDLESTVMMSPEEVAKLAELEANKNSDADVFAEPVQVSRDEEIPNTSENVALGATSESIFPTEDKLEPGLSTELPDAPLPEILAETGFGEPENASETLQEETEATNVEPPIAEPPLVEEPSELPEVPVFSEEATIYQFSPEPVQPAEEQLASFDATLAGESETLAEAASEAETTADDAEAEVFSWDEKPAEPAQEDEPRIASPIGEPPAESAPEPAAEPETPAAVEIPAEHEILKPVEELDLPD